MTIEYQKVWTTMNDLELVTSKICSAREIIDNAVDKIQEHEYDKAELLMTAAYEFLEYYLAEFDEKFKLAWGATVGDLRNGDKFQYTATGEKFFGKGASSIQYTEEELNAMCDKAELDAEVEQIRQEGGYDWTPSSENKKSEYYYDYTRNDPNKKNPFKTQNGVTYTEYAKAQIEAHSPYNDGWTQEYYQKIVDKYEGKQKEVKKWVLPVSEIGDNYFVTFPQDLLDAAKLKEGDEINWVDNGDGSFKIVKVTKPLGSDEC